MHINRLSELKIIYISYDGMTDSLGQSQVLPYLTELSKEGCSFHIVSLEKEEKFKKLRSHIQDICDAAGINWHPLPYQDKIPVFSAFSNFKSLKKKTLELQRYNSFDIAHCRSDIPGLIGHYLQRNFDVKFLFDMRGFWADERVEGGIWNKSNPVFKFLYSYFKKKETVLFREADAIVSLTEKGKEVISNMPDFKNEKLDISVIPCCVDLYAFSSEAIISEQQSELRNSLGISNETTVLGYLGSIGTWYMLDEMLQFYAVQRSKEQSSVFLFISGEKEQNIQEKAKKYGVPLNEVIVKSCLHNEVPLYISLFDYSIFFIRPTFSKSASSPTKQGELMAMKIPIVCNSGVGDTDLILDKYQAGSSLSELNKNAFSKWERKDMTFDPSNSRKGAEEWFSLEKGAKNYLSIYQRILSK
tara:strand:- start:88563 stop:89807 length:1245 start_codon:yes stop_codon:yes gene_type:complete